mgnify:CR=1 FL=1
MEREFIRVRSIKDVVIFALLIIAGVILALLPEASGANIGGWLLIIAGIAVAFTLKSAYMDVKTKAIYNKKEISLPGNIKAKVLSALASTPQTIDRHMGGDGQGLLLKIYFNKRVGRAYIQLFEYIPHQFEPCSEVYEYELSKVEKLIH